METHEAAKIFPLDEDTLEKLAQDISEHGLQEPIELYEGKILNGRRRQLACALAGVTPRYQDAPIPAGMTPMEYVIAKNLEQRDLSPAQKAAVAITILPTLTEEAKQRMAEGGTVSRRGRPIGGGKGSVIAGTGKSADKAAELLQIGASAVESAVAIYKRDPRVIDKMRSGEYNIAQAARAVGFNKRARGRAINRSGGLAPVTKDESGRDIPVYFGKGDKWSEATVPLIRYLLSWEKRDFAFRHVNSKEARKRLKVIAEIREKLDAAEADLMQRAHQATLTVTRRRN